MLLAGCGTAADVPSNRAVTDESRSNETDSEISIATTRPTLDIETSVAESGPASTTTSGSQAATETIPAPPPTTADGESSDEVDDSPASVGRDNEEDLSKNENENEDVDEDDSAAFPQVTFPEATVRDAEAEAADLERRRSVIGLFQRLLVEAEHRGGYDRNAIFGGWLYANGQSTRERVLADERHSDGSWNSAYDNTTVTSAGAGKCHDRGLVMSYDSAVALMASRVTAMAERTASARPASCSSLSGCSVGGRASTSQTSVNVVPPDAFGAMR